MEKGNELTNSNNNKLFNHGLFISIPDDETQNNLPNDINTNGLSQDNMLKQSTNSSLNPTPSDSAYGDKYLSHSLLKRLEEGTPVNAKSITLQMDNLNLESNNISEDQINEEKTTPQSNNEEEYIFEKFGKRGWECEKCNNFNFESRTKCNRCGIEKMPKSLQKIKEENELNNTGDKKKKPLVERKGDWQCPKCRNLNFAFRQSCNRCKLPKPNNINTSLPNQNNNTSPNNYMQNWGTFNIINQYPPNINAQNNQWNEQFNLINPKITYYNNYNFNGNTNAFYINNNSKVNVNSKRYYK